jgi:MinD-like ATPase involved in chromosome partitioning or flagellar assembly
MTDVAVAAGGAPWESEVLAQIDQASHLQLQRRCVDLAELLAVGRTGAVGLAVVATDLPGLDTDAVSRLVTGGVRVAAVGDHDRARALGIDLVVEPARLGVVDLSRPTPPPPPSRRTPLLVVWGPAGAPGRSTVALSVATATAAAGRRTALVDADTMGGSLAQSLGLLDDVSGIMAACRVANQGRADQVDEHLAAVEDRLHLLSGLPRGDMWPHVRSAALDGVVGRLRTTHDVVVADVGSCLEADGATRGRHQATLHLMEEADAIVVVGRADPVGLSRLVRGLADLQDVVGETEHQRIVVNQMRSSLGWSERDVADTLQRLSGRRPHAFLPWDGAGLDAAMMLGRTPRSVAPTSPFVRRVDLLVSGLVSGLGAGVDSDRETGFPVVASPAPQ